MSDLEARIAEVLGAHDFRIESHDLEHIVTIVCTCRKRYGLFGTYRAHVASMLAPVIGEREADAWDACVHAADKQWTIGHTSAQLLRNSNPYRSNE